MTEGRTYIIAEIGINHQGSLDLFKRMMLEAKRCGVDAVKGQKREPKECLTQEQYDRPYNSPHSFGATYGEHKEALEISADGWKELMDFADDVGITLFASVFDVTSARLMRQLGVDLFKLGSAEVTKTPLLEEVAGYRLPTFLSTGMSTLEEIDAAVDILRGTNLTLMHTTSCYPCPVEDLNLRCIRTLRERYKLPVGFSSHYPGVGGIDSAAVALGATAIERHFTLDRTMKGTDQSASLEPHGLETMVRYVRATEKALGSAEKIVLECEQGVRKKTRGT
jgi:N-acetylneuraminate synthase/sialic acid synthase